MLSLAGLHLAGPVWPEEGAHSRLEAIDLPHFDASDDGYDFPLSSEFIECRPVRMLRVDKRIYTIHESEDESEEEEQWSVTSSEI
jgi:hypothetical protein